MSRMSSSSSPFILISFIFITIQTFLLLAASWPAGGGAWNWSGSVDPNAFLICINHNSKRQAPLSTIYAPKINNTTFIEHLRSSAENLRFIDPALAKPQFFFTPLSESQVQGAVICAKFLHLEFRVLSGGHDYEGVSFVSYTGIPFFVIDLSRLRSITVDIEDGSAWAQAGATIGELYYRISQKSKTHAFPAGLCTTLGIGGHITGGGYGPIMRDFGLAVDNVLDAKIVDTRGKILDRNSMGEEFFWAIRGGGGGSFGVILAWKVKLVTIPKKVTYFLEQVPLEPQGTDIMYKWQQVADKIDNKLFIRVIVQSTLKPKDRKKTVFALYEGLFLGNQTTLLQLMAKSFPELGLMPKHCVEMSWIESVMYIAGFNSTVKPNYLLQAKPAFRNAFKAKSDYLQLPMSKQGLEGMWKIIMEDSGFSAVIFTPYGGVVNQIPDDATPFPHRNVSCMIQYVSQWVVTEDKLGREEWVSKLYDYMTPFVSKNPRQTYANYKDFEIGEDNKSNWSCPRLWGPKYFMNNFERLVRVKGMVDRDNVFQHELSIPTPSMKNQCTKLV